MSGLSNYIKDEKILSLVRMFIRMGDLTRTLEWSDREVGIPQGAILSPLLANLFLHRLDIWMQHQQINYVRYSDDFILLLRHENQAQSIFPRLRNYIEKNLGLMLNPRASSIAQIAEGVKFLGVYIKGTYITLQEEKRQRLQQKISAVYQIKNPQIHCWGNIEPQKFPGAGVQPVLAKPL